MKNITLTFIQFILSCFFFPPVSAQTKAVTDAGDQIILYDNHTWKYADDFKNSESFIKSNGESFKKNKESTFLLKSNKVHLGFWLNPKTWSFAKATGNPSAEYELRNKKASIQAIIIPEKVHLPLENLRSIVIMNAKKASPDYTVEQEEYRIVNDLKVLYLQSQGTILGIKFAFYVYGYSDSVSTVQLMVYGYYANKNNDQKIAEDLLNGLVMIDSDNKKDGGRRTTLTELHKDTFVQSVYSVNHNCERFFE